MVNYFRSISLEELVERVVVLDDSVPTIERAAINRNISMIGRLKSVKPSIKVSLKEY